MGKTTIKYRKIGKYSGFVVYGEKPFKENLSTHIDRAITLTSFVETGNKRGSIMSADGTAITAGQCQNILVYPRNTDEQGDLSCLLSKIFAEIEDLRVIKPLLSSFERVGWFVYNKKIRHKWNGEARIEGKSIKYNQNSVVNGSILRNELTGEYGVTPSKGIEKRNAQNWVILFHELFAHDSTEKLQMDFEKEKLANKIRKTKISINPRRRGVTLQKLFYKGEDPIEFNSGWMTPEMDLALCVFYSYSVNAPSAAKKVLEKVIDDTGFNPDKAGSIYEIEFAKELLRALGRSDYGRWSHEVKSGRWARTRKHAMNMNYWSKSFFAAQRYKGMIPVHFVY